MRIGLREANQRFSKVVKAVKGGEEVLLTERGKPLAVIKAVTGSEKKRGPSIVWRRPVCCGRLPRFNPCLCGLPGH